MGLRSFCTAILTTTCLAAGAQTSDTAFSKDWNLVDSLIITQDLTRSALDKVNVLYQKAKQRQLPAQELKALMYRFTLEDLLNTTNPALSINTVQAELLRTTDPLQKAVLNALLAKRYEAYFNRMRWTLYQRKQTQGAVLTDITTWSAADFTRAITNAYLAALKDKNLLQSQPVGRYDAILIRGNQRSVRPTLYDLLAQEALEFFRSDIYPYKTSANAFLLDDETYLQPADEFIKTSFPAKDSSVTWQAIRLYQQLLAFHSKDADKNALIDADLQRLQWVYSKSTAPNKNRLYETALHNIIEKYPAATQTAYAWLQLAELYQDRAATYNPFNDTTYRYDYVKALDMAEQALRIFGENSPAAPELHNLVNGIRAKYLNTQMEMVNIPGQPMLGSVQYRNTDTLYGRIVRIPATFLSGDNNTTNDRWQTLLKAAALRSFVQPLPAAADHQTHTTMIKLDALPAGQYVWISSSGKNFDEAADRISMHLVRVSAISYVKDYNELFVVNRKTGAPMPGVKVFTWRSRWDPAAKKQVRDTLSTKRTDEHGYAQATSKEGNWNFSFAMPGDTLDLNQGDYLFPSRITDDTDSETYEKRNARVFFFTDRGIYRPGQTVYFKGIAVTKDRSTGHSKLITGKEKEWVYLRDVNYKLVDSVSFTLNQYGSFSGQFRLPASGLTGAFHLETKNFNHSLSYFSVEEYKRPNFDVGIAKPERSYRLNDSVIVTGTATSYAGNPVSGARVVFNVTRNMRFLTTYLRRTPYPSGGTRQIAQGELTTDAQGKFTIRFRALADDIRDTLGDPMFDYQVTADVTDVNGETRSASTNITAGYRSLKLQLAVQEVSEKDSAHRIMVRTTNLSDQPLPADVTLQVFRLAAPQRMLRERLLPRPDQFTMSRETFLQYFPADEYDNESDPATWAKDGVAWQHTIATAREQSVTIDAGTLAAGNYLVEATTTDANGKTVTQTQLLRVFDRKDTRMPMPGSRFSYTANGTAEPGDTAVFLTGMPSDSTYVIRKTENEKASRYDFRYYGPGIKTLSYAPTEKDRGGVTINEVFVYNNRVYTNRYYVNVPWTNKTLAIRYETYRNKTEPGSQERWTVSIQGSKGEAAAAELLTAMYDASLDQFTAYNWSVPPVWQGNYGGTQFEGSGNFTLSYPVWQNPAEDALRPTIERTYDRLADDGETLWFDRMERGANDSSLPAAERARYNRQLADRRMAQSRVATRSAAMPAAPPAAGREVESQMLSEKVTVGYGEDRKAKESDSTFSVRGNTGGNTAGLYVVDGVVTEQDPGIPAARIASITTLTGDKATELYGSRAANGVIVITTTDAAGIAPVQVRKNLEETAFFFPQLHADSTGKYSFSFTMPEALTKWKWMTFAHTKELAFGVNSTTVVTQKQLMVQPNAPRFLREGDNMEFSAKIVNQGDKELKGQAILELVDATTNTSVDGWFQNIFPVQYFTVAPGQSMAVKFPVQIPFSYNRPVTWRIVARGGDLSDGEENTLPVLSNRMLVTETLPLMLDKDTTQVFRFEKLLGNASESLTHESITVEYTSNPVWYAVQSLPWLAEYPYECAEQVFNRFYANTLAGMIVNKHPRLKQVFAQWAKDSSALLSNLHKNEELKQVLLEETPWVFQAESEAQQRKNIAKLFDMIRIASQSSAIIAKLQEMQQADGSFSWFKGGYADRYITNYILTGIGKLKKLGALTPDMNTKLGPITRKALLYLDSRIADDYNSLVKSKADLNSQQVSGAQVEYLYMRSFFTEIPQKETAAVQYYYRQAKQYWVKFNTYYKALIGMTGLRQGEESFAVKTVLPAIVENASSDTKMGMYWKTAYTNAWYASPIEHQATIIAFVTEINRDSKQPSLTGYVDAMKKWLLLNKQTTHWGTTIATADACYALLLTGSDWISSERNVMIRLGNTQTVNNVQEAEAGTGYVKKRIDGKLVNSEMGNITVTTKTVGSSASAARQQPSWGSVYWQYFEDLDKITPAESPLSINKQLFIERNSAQGKVLQAVKDNEELKVGERVVVRMEIRTDRDMSYVHLKDMRAASMEPVNVLSGYRWQGSLGYYESTRDASTNFFFSRLPKGTHVFEYPLFVTHTGVFSAGVASIQCMYAPEFTAHSSGIKVRVQ